MPINSDLSGLPHGEPSDGFPPDTTPTVVGHLAEAFFRRYEDEGHTDLAMAVEGARWRASWSGMCARKVGYLVQHADAKRAMAAVPADAIVPPDIAEDLIHAVELTAPTDPPTLADYWRFNLGSMVHEIMQSLAVDTFPGAQIEPSIRIDDFGAAHVDLVIDELRYVETPDTDEGIQGDAVPFRTVVEIKSMNGYGAKLAATGWKGAPQGPRRTAIVQGAVSAEALNADRLIIAIFSLELLSPDVAARAGMDEIGRFAWEWSYTPDEFLPIAEKERKRVRKIIELVDEGVLPPRHVPDEMPAGARITDPARSAWTLENSDGAIVQAGEVWNGQFCRSYCDFFSQCVGDGPS